MSIISKKEYSFIDVGKFFAMFCVVMMHSIRENDNAIFKIVQMGCMAYFFFASGFCFKEDQNKCTPLEYLFKNIRAHIIPYLICSIIGIFICYKYPKWYTDNLELMLVYIFFLGQPLAFGLVWFLLCLFYLKITFYVFWKIVLLIKDKWIRVFLTLALYIFFLYLSIYIIKNDIRLLCKFDVAIVAMTFYILGFIVKYLNLYTLLENMAVAIIVFIITKSLSVYLEMTYMTNSNIVDFRFNNYFLWQIIQILSILSFLCIGMIFNKIRFLAYLGRNTFYPYIIHTQALWLIEEIYGKFITGTVKYSFTDLEEILPVSIICFIISYAIGEAFKKCKNLINHM